MSTKKDFLLDLLNFTESMLTFRQKRKLKQRMKQQAKHWLRDWVDTILWAVCMVIILNQYLFQMYGIPSGSMMSTLQKGDVIFVNKAVYGPELLPSVIKMPGFRNPERAEVVVFENPAYLTKGALFTILKQFVYIITLTNVDIDKDELGNPRVHYLIKRAVGVGGDTIKVKDGEVSFLFKGIDKWITERDYQKASGFIYPLTRLVSPNDYDAIHRAGREKALIEMGLLDKPTVSSYNQYDEAAFRAEAYSELAAAYPHDMRIIREAKKNESGWFVPHDRIFTLGDNRDNSKDARWYGAVSLKKVLGHALFRHWPPSRIGGIH